MTTWWLSLVLVAIGTAGLAVIGLARRAGKASKRGPGKRPAQKPDSASVQDAVDRDVEHVFNEEFREELRNRGRLNFEKIISENAMFLQQDLRLTTAQLNQYMKDQITSKLTAEFDKYEQSITDAKELAIASIQKTNAAIDEQRHALGKQMQAEILAEKQQVLERFEANMGEIVNHYVLAAVGNQIDLSDQLEYILAEMEANKQAIIEDVKNGA